MRIGVLMTIGVPWARQVALAFARLGDEVHAIDFEDDAANQSYLKRGDGFQQEDLEHFRRSIAGLHFLPRLGRGYGRYVFAAPALRRLAAALEVDLLLSLYGGGFALLACASGVRPYAVYVVGSDILLADGPRRFVLDRVLTRASLVCTNGRHLLQQTKRVAPRARAELAYMGIDLGRFCRGHRPSAPLRIVCTRGFLPVYNNEALVRALAADCDWTRSFEVVFTSAGPLQQHTKELAERLSKGKDHCRVIFRGGVTDAELRALLSTSHVYVSLSRSDGSSISLLEAMAAGCFPVVSDIPANHEWIEPGQGNGICIDADDYAGIARAIERAMSNESLRATAASRNAHITRTRADLTANMAAVQARLRSVATAHA
jgi:glycosyltransferase involved in cell wall biosynthesis